MGIYLRAAWYCLPELVLGVFLYTTVIVLALGVPLAPVLLALFVFDVDVVGLPALFLLAFGVALYLWFLGSRPAEWLHSFLA